MAWWLWIVIALGLAALEAVTPGGFVTLFFAVGAFVVGLLALAGGLASLLWQGLWFSAISVAALLLFRRRLLEGLDNGRRPAIDSLVGEAAVLMEDLPGDGIAKAELRGTSWSVRSANHRPLVKGQRCRVESVDGLTLWIRSE